MRFNEPAAVSKFVMLVAASRRSPDGTSAGKKVAVPRHTSAEMKVAVVLAGILPPPQLTRHAVAASRRSPDGTSAGRKVAVPRHTSADMKVAVVLAGILPPPQLTRHAAVNTGRVTLT